LQHDKFVDLLRNCCAAYDICKERGWDLSIDISLHPLANLFLCKVPSRNNVTVVRANSCEEFLNSICNTDDLQININADLYPQQNPTTECNAYIIENFLALRPEFEDFLNETLTNLSLERKNYCVVYIEQGYQSFLEKIDEKVVLVCTEQQLRQSIVERFGFISWIDNENEQKRQILLFFLCAFARKVTLFGKSDQQLIWSACKIFNVELDEHDRSLDFAYGVDGAIISCEKEARRQFTSFGQVLVKRKDIFNDLFGDVAQNREKTLRITFDDRVSLSLPENRARGYLITQIDT